MAPEDQAILEAFAAEIRSRPAAAMRTGRPSALEKNGAGSTPMDSVLQAVLRTRSALSSSGRSLRPSRQAKPIFITGMWRRSFVSSCGCTGVRRLALLINQPPRSLKSICVSVAYVAWLLGHDPTRPLHRGELFRRLRRRASPTVSHGGRIRRGMRSFSLARLGEGNRPQEFVTTRRRRAGMRPRSAERSPAAAPI